MVTLRNRQGNDNKMEIITLINEKGGVGKTTNANTIAGGLAIRGQRVLLLDADPQANTTTANRAKPLDALYRVIAQDGEWADYILDVAPEIWAGDYHGSECGSVYLLPSHTNNRLLPLAIDDVDLLAERLEELSDSFDTVVIDSSPTPSMLHANIYRAASHAIIPTEFELWSMQGMVKTINRLQNEAGKRGQLGLPPLNILGIQPNKHEGHTNAHRYGLAQTRERFGDFVWEPIAKRVAWRNAAWSVRNIFSAEPGTEAEQEAWGLVDRVMAVTA